MGLAALIRSEDVRLEIMTLQPSIPALTSREIECAAKILTAAVKLRLHKKFATCHMLQCCSCIMQPGAEVLSSILLSHRLDIFCQNIFACAEQRSCMALVVVSGQPCSGKSTASAKLKELLQSKGLQVSVIDEPTLQLIRNDSYKGETPMVHAPEELESVA